MAAVADSHPHEPLRAVIEHEQSARHRRIGVWVTLLVVAVAGIVALTVVLWPHPTPLSGRFREGDVAQSTVVRQISATGRLEPQVSVEVGAQISGRIATVEADYNDHVHRGQVLARFDTEGLDAQLAQSEASVKAARAAVQQARTDHKRTQQTRDRTQRLFDRGIESREALDNAVAAEASAAAGVKSAVAQLDLQRANARVADTNLRYAEIVSPIDGVVISRDIEAGQTVVAAFQTPVLFLIAADLTKMKVVASIDEADIGDASPGQSATFTVDAYPDRVFDARLTELRSAAKLVQNVVTYEAVLEVDNDEELLRPGMTASVKVKTATADDALHIPNAALRFTPPEEEEQHNQHTVWVLRDDELMPLHVVPGISDGSVTVVEDDGTLHPGDSVLVDLTPEGRKLYGADDK